jgi:fructose-1,6-bisphosphatase I
MDARIPLEDHLAGWQGADARRQAIAETILIIAGAARDVARAIAETPLGWSEQSAAIEDKAAERFQRAISSAPVAALAMRGQSAPSALKAGAPLAVAMTALDNPSNAEANAPAGTLFSILPMAADADATFRQPGTSLLAAGYILYGPRTALVLTLGNGTHSFFHDSTDGRWHQTRSKITIAHRTREYAIDASNGRHWSDPVRTYIADCVAGQEGPRRDDYKMRWLESLAAECHRVLARGGIVLYPSDKRTELASGRLRLVTEACPIAMLVEQAGGEASNGRQRTLELIPSDLTERTPLVFGSRNEVHRLIRYKTDRHAVTERSPLFGQRGLFRT